MKTLLPFCLLLISLENIAQNPHRIHVHGTLTYAAGSFKTNTSFVKDQRNYSNDKRYCLVFQSDGNLVVYKMNGNKYSAIWNTGTNGIAMKSCIFQEDGNLVLYDYTGKARWDARTVQYNAMKKKTSGDVFMPTLGKDAWLTLQNDGNLVIYPGKYPSAANPFWNSGTYEKN